MRQQCQYHAIATYAAKATNSADFEPQTLMAVTLPLHFYRERRGSVPSQVTKMGYPVTMLGTSLPDMILHWRQRMCHYGTLSVFKS